MVRIVTTAVPAARILEWTLSVLALPAAFHSVRPFVTQTRGVC